MLDDQQADCEVVGAIKEPVRLGTLEAQVMGILWDTTEATVRGIIAMLPAQPAYTTISTVLRNLGKKGLVRCRKQGHTAFFQARITREQHAAMLMEHALGSSGDRAVSLLYLVESLQDEELEMLRGLLAGREKATPNHG